MAAPGRNGEFQPGQVAGECEAICQWTGAIGEVPNVCGQQWSAAQSGTPIQSDISKALILGFIT